MTKQNIDNVTRVTAAMLAIGDELLSGRTKDANIHHLAKWLTERGIDLVEVRVVNDQEPAIVHAVNSLRDKVDYVFTSGGIGPTHDDITFTAIAKAFNLNIERHPKAFAALEKWYSERNEPVTPERARMAEMPEGAELIHNSASGAPGVMLDNVFVMAGVPRIFNAMLEAIDDHLQYGQKLTSRTVTAYKCAESRVARQLADLQQALHGVTFGSYPIDGDEGGVTIVARSSSTELADQAIEAVTAIITALGYEAEPVDRR